MWLNAQKAAKLKVDEELRKVVQASGQPCIRQSHKACSGRVLRVRSHHLSVLTCVCNFGCLYAMTSLQAAVRQKEVLHARVDEAADLKVLLLDAQFNKAGRNQFIGFHRESAREH